MRKSDLDEADRRAAMMDSGEDPGLSIEEFFADRPPSVGETDVDQAWIDVAERRYDEWKAGRATMHSAEDVLAAVRANLHRHVSDDESD